jgi:hypothetical protein
MREEVVEDFLNTMGIEDLDEAIYMAMAEVGQQDGLLWFGKIGNGYFYADSDGSHWLPDMSRYEAINAIGADGLGKDADTQTQGRPVGGNSPPVGRRHAGQDI